MPMNNQMYGNPNMNTQGVYQNGSNGFGVNVGAAMQQPQQTNQVLKIYFSFNISPFCFIFTLHFNICKV